MNDSTSQSIQRLKQMLEEVTAADTSAAGNTVSAGHSTSESHDAETASLREAWLAFGQLIRAADASLAAMPNVATPPPKPRRSRWLGLVGCGGRCLACCGYFRMVDRPQRQAGQSRAVACAEGHARSDRTHSRRIRLRARCPR